MLNLPIFGFGAKTSPYSPQPSSLFPLSRSLRNPFTPNNLNLVDQQYTDCLSALELAVPVNMAPLFEFLLSLGQRLRKQLDRKAKKSNNANIYKTIDSFYVLYVFSTGVIDDFQALLRVVY